MIAPMMKKVKKRGRGRPKIECPKNAVVRARVDAALYARFEAFRKAEGLGTDSDAIRVLIERLPVSAEK